MLAMETSETYCIDQQHGSAQTCVKWPTLHAAGAKAFCHGAFQQATYFFPYCSIIF
jgi:hypothetical protein